MGPSPSYVLNRAFARQGQFEREKESVFEVSPDEQAFCTEFESPFKDKPPNEGQNYDNLPDENMIVDIMTDPIMYTQVSTAIEAWQEVITPLFSGSHTLKPCVHQFLKSYYKFLKERPNKFLDNEDERIKQRFQQTQSDNQRLIQLHSKFKKPAIEITEELLSGLNTPQNILDIIPDTPICNYHPSYYSVTKKIISFLNSYFAAYVAVRWGFFSCDITPIIAAYKYLIKNPNETIKSNHNFPHIRKVLDSISLENALFVPNNQNISYANLIGFKMSKLRCQSMMASNGKFIYILGAKSKLTIISLSRFVNNNTLRFRNFDLNINKKKILDSFIAISNGFFIIGGKFLKHEKIYSTQPFSLCSRKAQYIASSIFRNTPRLTPPLTCDGTYIYSLVSRKKIAVFSLDSEYIIFHRYIKLRKGTKCLMEPYKHLVPKVFNNAHISTNGVFFSFIILKNSTPSQFQYFMRSFSLSNGNHVNDTMFNLKWPIQSLIFDPWNHCGWALSTSSEGKANLLKIPFYASMPPWISGTCIECCSLNSRKIEDELKNLKNNIDFSNALLDTIMYFSFHYCGALFEASFSNIVICYNFSSAYFLAPCTQEFFENIIDVIQLLLDQYKSKKEKNEYNISKTENSLRAFISLLQYNLSNSSKRTEERLSSTIIDNIINLMKNILNDDSFAFLSYNASFLILTSFENLFSERKNLCPEIYYLIICKIDRDDFLYFALQRLASVSMLPYCVSNKTCHNIIDPIFEQLISHPLDPPMTQVEFISMYQFSLMIEMRKIYYEYPNELPPAQMQLQQTFFSYSRSITERVLVFVQQKWKELENNRSTNTQKTHIESNLENILKYSIFFRLFRKWLMLLQPLAKFSRVSQNLVIYLSSMFPFFQKILEVFPNTENSENAIDFNANKLAPKIFNELFSIYIDFISSLLNGGEELLDATKHLWLVRSTLEAKITPQMLDSVTNSILSESSSSRERKKLLSRGISFDITNSNDSLHGKDSNSKAILDLLSQAILPNESPNIKMLFDYLYSKIKSKGPTTKITDSDRHIERMIFIAFMKQLGFGNEVVELNINLLAGVDVPVLSHFIRMAFESVYRSRREIRAAKQNAIQNQDMEKYKKYIKNIKTKCIFLMYIQPCLRYQSLDIDIAFPKYLKFIQSFILGQIGIDQCFKIIETSESSRRHISTGLKLLNDVLKSNISVDLTTFMLEKLSASESIMKYLSTLPLTSTADTNDNTGFINVMMLLDNLSRMVSKIPNDSLSNALIIFYSNLLLTIVKMNQEAIFNPLNNILDQLIEKQKNSSQRYINSYIAIVASCLYVLLSDSPQLRESSHFNDLQNIFLKYHKLEDSQIYFARFCLASGVNLSYTAEQIFNFIKTCDPSLYHPAFSLLYEIIKREKNNAGIFKLILKEISLICSGSVSTILSDMPTIDKYNTSENNISRLRTPEMAFSICSSLIQICRRFLSANNEFRTVLLSIFKYILSNSKNIKMEENIDKNDEFKVYKDPIYLFGVFGILSNTIDSFRNYSLIKDISNNTLYYVKNVNQNKEQFSGWELPFNGNSIQCDYTFSTDLLPVSSIPFTPDLFPEYSLLMPFFINAIEKKETSNRDEALAYFILSSFSIYLSNLDFLKNFLILSSKSDAFKLRHYSIKSITFSHASKDFIDILKMHLTTDSLGFSMNHSNSTKMMHCSPAHIVNPDNFKITGNEISTEAGIHVFISSVLSQKQTSFLEINFNGDKKLQINIGVHVFSQNPSTSSTYLYEFKTQSILYNSYVIKKIVNKNENMNSVIISFNPIKSKAVIYDALSMNKLHSMVVPQNRCCFIIQIIGSAKLNYHLTHTSFLFSSKKVSNAMFLCPLSGKAIFKRNTSAFHRKITKHENKTEALSNLLKNPLIYAKQCIPFNLDIFSASFFPMEEHYKIGFTEKFLSTQIVNYPISIIKIFDFSHHSISEQLQNNFMPISLGDTPKNLIQPPSFASFKLNNISNCPIKMPSAVFYESNKDLSPMSYKFERSQDAINIDMITGEVDPIDKSKLQQFSYLPPLHPSNYPILPTEILNLFSTGYVEKIRNEIINQIFIRSIVGFQSFKSQFSNTLSLTLEDIFQSFEIDEIHLIEYSTLLMLFLEPIHFQLIHECTSPINFSFNLMDPKQKISSTKYIHSTALNTIFSFFNSHSNFTKIMTAWLTFLKHQFSNPQSHFMSKNHPYSVTYPLSVLSEEPKLISIQGASSLIIFKTGFNHTTPSKQTSSTVPSPIIATIDNGHGLQNPEDQQNSTTIPINNQIVLINNDSITLYYNKPNNVDENNNIKTPSANVSTEGPSIVVLPVFYSSNESLFGTFFQFVISFKYFVIFVSQHINDIDHQTLLKIKSIIYQIFIDSFIAESPFFYMFGHDIINFLSSTLPTSGSDLCGDILVKFSLLSIYYDTNKFPFITHFLEEQQMIWLERILLPLKKLFPEFLTEDDKREIAQIDDQDMNSIESLSLGFSPLPAGLPPKENEISCEKIAGQLKRIMKPRTSIVGYPFHLLIHLWAKNALLYPPFKTQILSDTLIKIEFLYYTPKTVVFVCDSLTKLSFKYSTDKDMSNSTTISSDSTITVNNSIMYFELSPGNSWYSLIFTLSSSDVMPFNQFLFAYKEGFVSDITKFVMDWNIKDDEKILACFPLESFSAPAIDLNPKPQYLLHTRFPLPMHLIIVRATLLFALNWIIYYDKVPLDDDPLFSVLSQSMSMSLRMKRFTQLIEQQSNDYINEIIINRKLAYEVRTGGSQDLNQTIIAQFTNIYYNPVNFRKKGDKPWRITLVGESSIDAGGPAKEIIAEAAIDLVSPNCGLFVQVPNGRNEIGDNREFFVPIADPRISNARKRYKFGGVLIGICIRSQIVQDFPFAPFVWEYLATGKLKIEDIFKIDSNYKALIHSLTEASKSEISENSFQSRFNLRFIINNMCGKEVPLIQRGRLEKVTLANVNEFISLANEYRLSEVRGNLEAMREGLWENLDFKPPVFITAEMLEILACGNKEISAEDLLKIIRFDGFPNDQIDIFKSVVSALTSKQRSALLKFITGRVRLPKQVTHETEIKADYSPRQRDVLPTATTCFNQLHVPFYSSYEKALRLITIAIEFTCTFENR